MCISDQGRLVDVKFPKMHKTSSLLVLATLVVVSLSACSPQQSIPSAGPLNGSPSGIVNGELVTEFTDARSTTVQIYNQDPARKATCTGTLIAEDVVLTSAHCVTETAPTKLRLSVGFSEDFQDSFGPYGTIPAARAIAVIKHPSYVHENKLANSAFDLALIQFVGPLPTDFKARALPEAQASIVPTDHLRLIGFGSTSEASNDDGVLREITLPITQIARTSNVKIAGNIVVQQPDGGICQGDSGGPLYVESDDGTLTMIGVTSKNGNADDPAFECHGFALFTDLRTQLSWIRESLSNLK